MTTTRSAVRKGPTRSIVVHGNDGNGSLLWLHRKAVKVSVIIPVFNEEGSIRTVLDEILGLDLRPIELEIIVSDDGSADRTAELLDPYVEQMEAVRVVTSEANHGKGAAIRKGLAGATGEVVLIQDADTEYSPADYPALLAPFVDDSADVVYGSRFLERRWPEGMKLQNWLANRFFTATANLLYGGAITDEGTGYKLVRRELLQDLGLETTGFDFCAEVTAKLLSRDVEILEVPVSYRARGRTHGKKPGFLDGVRVLRTLIKYRLPGAGAERSGISGE